MNIAYHELMNGGTLMIDPNRDVNEVCAIILAGKKNGCVILGGGSPKNFYLQGQPTLWEVYGIPKGGNDYFIQFTTDQVVWGGLSGATPAEAVSWGKVNPGVLPDTVVAYVRLDDRLSAVLRVRRRLDPQPAPAQGTRAQARGAGRGSAAAGERRRPPPRNRSRTNRRRSTGIDRSAGAGCADITWALCLPSSRRIAVENTPPRIYADANMPNGVVSFMRTRLGWDVFFVMEHDELRRARDTEHYRLARQLARTLVTLDRDYEDDRRFPPAEGAGVIVFSAPDERRLCRLLTRGGPGALPRR